MSSIRNAFKLFYSIGITRRSHLPLILRAVQNAVGKRVLDVGCGTGAISYEIAKTDRFVVGVDVYDQRRFGSFEFLKASMNQLPFQSELFSCVVCSSVLQYAMSPRNTILDIYRLLEPGGIIVISVPSARPHLYLTRSILYRRLATSYGLFLKGYVNPARCLHPLEFWMHELATTGFSLLSFETRPKAFGAFASEISIILERRLRPLLLILFPLLRFFAVLDRALPSSSIGTEAVIVGRKPMESLET